MPEPASLYRMLFLIRRVEEEIARLYPTNKIRSPVHLSIGQEGVAVAVAAHLHADDVVFASYRGHAAYLAKGGDLPAMMAELYGKGTGCAKGKAGSMHLVDARAGVLGTSAVVGTGIANATGYAYALKLRRSSAVVVCFFGDGATEEGVFYESLNFAALKRLPILYVCENNFYAIHTHQSKRQAVCDIAGRARAQGLPAVTLGSAMPALLNQVNDSLTAIRAGGGPQLLECQCYRHKEHVGPGEDYHLGYRQATEATPWREADSLVQVAAWLDPATRRELEAAVETQVAAAIAFAEDSPWPEATELLRDVYRERG